MIGFCCHGNNLKLPNIVIFGSYFGFTQECMDQIFLKFGTGLVYLILYIFALVRLVGMFMLPWQPSPKLTIEKYVGCIKLLFSKTARYFGTEILHEDVEP